MQASPPMHTLDEIGPLTLGSRESRRNPRPTSVTILTLAEGRVLVGIVPENDRFDRLLGGQAPLFDKNGAFHTCRSEIWSLRQAVSGPLAGQPLGRIAERVFWDVTIARLRRSCDRCYRFNKRLILSRWHRSQIEQQLILLDTTDHRRRAGAQGRGQSFRIPVLRPD